MKHPSAERYYVYSSFSKSIAFLKEKGAKTFQESEDIRITNMEIFGNKYEDTHMYVSDLKQLKERENLEKQQLQELEAMIDEAE